MLLPKGNFSVELFCRYETFEDTKGGKGHCSSYQGV